MAETLSGLDELIRLRQRWTRLLTGGLSAGLPGEVADGRLAEVKGFGSNPGGLRMLSYAPPDLPPGAPLVVALHGCTQTAAGYDQGCGWSDMADRLGFALLLPEQDRGNNAYRCFNWFNSADTLRNAGEALSIRQMVEWMLQEHGLDRGRVFISGLSAGGGMTSVMLATYPEVFAAGAILAGLPYGAASDASEALEVMRQAPQRSAGERGEAVRAASAHPGPWPRVSVWQGETDSTVHPGNAEEVLKQWLDLHGLTLEAPDEVERSELVVHRRWHDADGRVLVESHRIAGMEHGVPLHAGTGAGQVGVAGPHLLDVGISSTHGILRFWGLGTDRADMPRHFRVNSQGEAQEMTPRRFGPARLLDKALRFARLR
ncbi:PHB depolymerase family esterase [Roseomonas sp. E05]|uniref:extracellular catalytic domain type 1 short-chain-length polyhydroxyalkanoate depolymerase n=1 Tax=Roseomonas sp. E05 TaxID=3046310 RepID=UPI0024B8A096|nr:PHB depolymerase family esterase [Roseomonas sp. E05]MDJ0388004.1 PHB depolymerase family esterase [Roseomonas sp. E05]